MADRCVQILGGMGISDETPVGMIFSDMRAFRLYDGPTEVHKYAIARQVAEDPAMSLLDSFRLDDKVVIVTGASSGLGVSFAQAFAQAGAHLVLGARRVEQMTQTAALVEEAGRKAYTRKTDVADPEQCQQLVDSAVEEFGRVDVLINNAGVGTAVPRHPGGARGLPQGHRRQPQRLLLDGPGLRPVMQRGVRSSTSPASWASPPPDCRRPPTPHPRPASSA